MTAVRITKMERHPDGFFTARVTASGLDTVRVDNSCGSWTFTIDQRQEPGAKVSRRDVLPWCARLLVKRMNAVVRGESFDENEASAAPKSDNYIYPAGSRAGRAERRAVERRDAPTSTTDAIARKMAKAALTAVKEAA